MNYLNLKIYIYLHKQFPSSRVIVSPSLGTTVLDILLGNLLLQELSYISTSRNYILLSNLLLQVIVSPSVATTVYSSQQSPSSRVIVSPSVATTVHSSQQSPSPIVIIYLHLWELSSSQQSPSARAISISRSIFVSISNLLLQELLYLHLWELQYILFSNVLLQELLYLHL
jgi:hypothetical protein